MKGIKVCCENNKNLKNNFFKNEIFIIFIIFIIFVGVFFLKNTKKSVQTNPLKLPVDQILIENNPYLDYSEQNFNFSKSKGKTLLFFAATTWCSSCVALEDEIKKGVVNIPKNITILKVDYDHDKKLVNKYRVIQQTTLVLLDNSGLEIRRWIGTNLDNLLQNIN